MEVFFFYYYFFYYYFFNGLQDPYHKRDPCQGTIKIGLQESQALLFLIKSTNLWSLMQPDFIQLSKWIFPLIVNTNGYSSPLISNLDNKACLPKDQLRARFSDPDLLLNRKRERFKFLRSNQGRTGVELWWRHN